LLDAKSEEVLRLITKLGVVRPMDLVSYGVSRVQLRHLLQNNLIEKMSRGIYHVVDANISEYHSLAEASKKVPNGVVCLLSALRYHDLTTQNPFEVWMAIGAKSHLPKAHEQGVRFYRFSTLTLEYGVVEQVVEGVRVRIFDPAKTVADCFKYRNKIGTDIALEALRDCWRQRKATMDELWLAAKVCRVANVMRPYMESLV